MGNTPLHYAAKHGHVDNCKILVDRKASILKRNKQNKTAYEVSEGHDVVRQYLLPLVLQAENSQVL